MSIVKSFSVGNGDMFYICHNSDNFTVIDCCYDSGWGWKRQKSEIIRMSKNKNIKRFISTHPDEDHIRGLCDFDDSIGIVNFYCVQNGTTKDDETEDFKRYCELRNGCNAFYLHSSCTRRWMNLTSEDRESAGIHCHWPITNNCYFQEELKKCKNGESPNNISPILTYSTGNVKFMWMGDLETDFIEKIKGKITFPNVDVLFAPHHGRDSGKIPSDVLKKIAPRIVVIGEAPSESLNYYRGYNTITQNTAGDITFETTSDGINIWR